MVKKLFAVVEIYSRHGQKISRGGGNFSVGGIKISRGLIEKFVAAVEVVAAWSQNYLRRSKFIRGMVKKLVAAVQTLVLAV